MPELNIKCTTYEIVLYCKPLHILSFTLQLLKYTGEFMYLPTVYILCFQIECTEAGMRFTGSGFSALCPRVRVVVQRASGSAA